VHLQKVNDSPQLNGFIDEIFFEKPNKGNGTSDIHYSRRVNGKPTFVSVTHHKHKLWLPDGILP
jgi:hypothetical protein